MYKIGVRHVQVMLLALNCAVLYLNRLHLAVTILAMTKNTEETEKKFMIFDWNESQKSVILSSFYWGYFAGQIPSGFLVRRYNAKLTLFFCALTTGIFSLLIPFCVPLGNWKVFCTLRALQGVFQGCHYPAFQQHLAKWSPYAERSLLNGLSNAGYQFGAALAMFLGGMIAVSSLGWPGTFYISAASSFAWCILWLLFSANDFSTSKFISTAERDHIESSLRRSVNFSRKKEPIPWRKILSSPPFWSILFMRATHNFSHFILLYYMPTYMSAIFKLTLNDNAFYSALPYILQILSTYIFTILGDWIMRREILSLTALRKLFNTIAVWLPAAIMIWLGFVMEQQKVLLVVLFVVLGLISTASTLGSVSNIIDLAPNYVAIVVTLINTFGNFASMLGPLCVALIVSDEQNRNQWRMVFVMCAVVICVGDLVYLIWATAETQTWNSASDRPEVENREKAHEKQVHEKETTLHTQVIQKTIEHINPAFVRE